MTPLTSQASRADLSPYLLSVTANNRMNRPELIRKETDTNIFVDPRDDLMDILSGRYDV